MQFHEKNGFIWFHEFICLDFFKFSGALCQCPFYFLDLIIDSPLILDNCIDTELPNQVPDQPVSNNSMDEVSDPFDPKIRTKLLDLINNPLEKRHGYISLENQKIPNIRPHSNVFIGGSTYVCKEAIGQGAFGKIFKAQDANR